MLALLYVCQASVLLFFVLLGAKLLGYDVKWYAIIFGPPLALITGLIVVSAPFIFLMGMLAFIAK